MFDADYNPPLRAAMPAAVARGARTATARRWPRLIREASKLSDAPGSPRDFSDARYADRVRGDAAAVGPGHAARPARWP